MEMKVIKCPNCGANAKNHTNCEYCGSLLVRFVDKGIEIKDTSYIDNSMVFPGLLEELKKNIKLQEKESNEEVWTEISWINKRGDEDYLMISSKESDYDSDEKEIDSSSNKDMLLTPQLVIQMCFSNWKGDDESTFYHNKEQDEQLMRFTQLKSFPLFTYKEYERDKDDDIYLRNFDINFGQDANGASRLISEILVKVKGLALSDSYGIYTGIGEEYYAEEYKEYRRKKGLPVVEGKPTDENSENVDDESDYSEDQEDKGLEDWQKIFVYLLSGPIGLCIIENLPHFTHSNWYYLIACILLLIVLGLFWIGRLPKKYFYFFLIPYFILPICFLTDFKMPKFKWQEQKESSDKVELLEKSNEKEQIEEIEQTPKKSRKDEIRELGYNDGVNFGYSDGGDALRDYVQAGMTLENGLSHIQGVIARVAYKEDYGDNISDELLDEYCKQFIEGYKSVVLKK